MLKLIQADLYRLAHSRMIHITFLLCILMYILIDLLEVPIIIMSYNNLPEVNSLKNGAYGIYYGIGTPMNIPLMALPIYVSVMGHDYSSKTIYNTLASGYTKNDYFLSKVFVTVITTLVFYLSLVFVPMAVGTLLYGFGLQEPMGLYWKRLLITLIFQGGFLSLFGLTALVICVFVQSTSKLISFYIMGLIGFGTLFLMTLMNDSWITARYWFYQYWMLGVIENEAFGIQEYTVMTFMIITSLCIFIGIGLLKINKSDIH